MIKRARITSEQTAKVLEMNNLHIKPATIVREMKISASSVNRIIRRNVPPEAHPLTNSEQPKTRGERAAATRKANREATERKASQMVSVNIDGSTLMFPKMKLIEFYYKHATGQL